QFPLNRTTGQDLSIPAQCSNDGFVGDDIDLGVEKKTIYNRRSSSTDQLDILGPFELSPSNSNSTNSHSDPDSSANLNLTLTLTLNSITNTKTSAQKPNHQTHTWDDGISTDIKASVMPGSPSNGMSNSNQGAPWNHLYTFDYSATSRNRRNVRGLEITPVHSAYTTARASPDHAVAPDSGIWQSPNCDESIQVSNPTYCYNFGISPTSGAQTWPSPPDSGVVFVSSDSFANSKSAGIAENHSLNPPETVPHLAQDAGQETADPQPRHTPFYEHSQPQHKQTEDYQPGQERRVSSDTGYGTPDQDAHGLPQYQIGDHPDHQDDGEVKPLRPTDIIEQPAEARIERPSIKGTYEHFQPDVASSLPPIPECFPEYWPVKSNTRLVQHSKSTSGPFAFRPSMRNPRVNRKVSVPTVDTPLSVIHENRKGAPHPSQQATRKGRRAGPLSKAKATQAAIIRKNKSVCIRCKMMKQSCSGEVPCLGCRENLGAKIWKSPCVRADFLDIVEAGSCNYISQRRINHFTLDQSRRVTMLLPETFDLTELLDLLKPRLSRFNIHARQLSGSLFTLDLAKCYDFLTEIHSVQESGVFVLRDFIDNKLLKVSDWLKCVTEPCSISESLSLLAKWNNMPSRASYDIVSLVEGFPGRPMNVEDDEDKKEIVIAAQLSRIICRALEVAAYRFLQKELNNLTKKSNEDAEKFVQELGQILLTLRWRISWWQILGDGSKVRDSSTERYIDRVYSLTRVLYFYYCNAKKKLPPWLNPQSLKGVRSIYADTELAVFDDFPCDDSVDGFDDWMQHGQELIHQAGVQQRLSRY
ncbi:hypothetical protein MMC29_001331, partial [Sticta canariensis]|nr:hypothetical protein [Sticta canariensis]